MIARVLASDAAAVGQLVVLGADEASYVGRVLRLRPGGALRVFDGRGHEWTATLTSLGGDRAEVRLGADVAPAPEPHVRYTVAPAVLKGDATDDVVRDAVMMGAVRLRPFVATRSGVRLATVARGARQPRWQRVAVASARQCGRAVVPVIDPPVGFDEVLATAAGELRLLLVEPGVGGEAMAAAALPRPAAVTLAIGPEGGWTAEEIAASQAAGWTLVRLGLRTVRAAAMALVALAACQAVWNDA
ncbi:MAG: 16S rRNA (uracil(1498)-N(3))-methyltransferase [Vicinamibacterales bacterium]